MNDAKTMQEMSRVLAAMEDVVVTSEEDDYTEFTNDSVMGEGALPVEDDGTDDETDVELAVDAEASENREPSVPVDPPSEPPPPPPPTDNAEQTSEEEEEEEVEPSNSADTTTSTSAETDIVLALMGWCNAWNGNNVEAYLDAYEPNATYISESLLRANVSNDNDIVLRGHTAIRKLFRSVFDTVPPTLLRYSQIQVERMGARHASVFGRFTLTLKKKNVVADTGVFTLCVVQNDEGIWKIQTEHSSSSMDPHKKKKRK